MRGDAGGEEDGPIVDAEDNDRARGVLSEWQQASRWGMPWFLGLRRRTRESRHGRSASAWRGSTGASVRFSWLSVLCVYVLEVCLLLCSLCCLLSLSLSAIARCLPIRIRFGPLCSMYYLDTIAAQSESLYTSLSLDLGSGTMDNWVFDVVDVRHCGLSVCPWYCVSV